MEYLIRLISNCGLYNLIIKKKPISRTGMLKTVQSRQKTIYNKMKKLILTMTFLLVTTLSFCQNQKITYSKDYSGNTVAKDEYGNVIAIASTDYSGKLVWKDKYGNVIKTESEDYSGRTVTKDQYGNTQTTKSKDYAGNTVEKDQYGNVLYTYSKDYSGNTVKKDKYGNVLGTYKEDYSGNLVFYPKQ